MKNRIQSLLVVAALACVGLALPAVAQEGKETQPATPKAPEPKRVGDPYPLNTCPISGKKLGAMGDPVVKVYEGREVRFCCNMCPPRFEKDQAQSIAKLDDAIIKDQLPIYALDTSVISGKKLGDKPLNFVYANRLIRVVDESEKAEFLKDPKKHLATLDKAVVEAQKKDYPLAKCPVSDEELGKGDMGEPKDLVVAGRLIRLCCGSCVKDVNKDPAKYIAMVDAAQKGNPK